jgi:hypothetical protein
MPKKKYKKKIIKKKIKIIQQSPEQFLKEREGCAVVCSKHVCSASFELFVWSAVVSSLEQVEVSFDCHRQHSFTGGEGRGLDGASRTCEKPFVSQKGKKETIAWNETDLSLLDGCV